MFEAAYLIRVLPRAVRRHRRGDAVVRTAGRCAHVRHVARAQPFSMQQPVRSQDAVSLGSGQTTGTMEAKTLGAECISEQNSNRCALEGVDRWLTDAAINQLPTTAQAAGE